MQPDIQEKIIKDFENPDEIIRILEAFVAVSKYPQSDRVCRAIIFLSKGDVKELHACIDRSFFDCRGFLHEAENDSDGKQNYDFNESFSSQGL